jgi:hypothetical protein
VAGAVVHGTVQRIDGEELVLLDPKGKPQKVALASLDAEMLMRRISETKLEIGAPETCAFAQALLERKTWSKGLDAAQPGVKEFLEKDEAQTGGT